MKNRIQVKITASKRKICWKIKWKYEKIHKTRKILLQDSKNWFEMLKSWFESGKFDQISMETLKRNLNSRLPLEFSLPNPKNLLPSLSSFQPDAFSFKIFPSKKCACCSNRKSQIQSIENYQNIHTKQSPHLKILHTVPSHCFINRFGGKIFLVNIF